MRIALANLGTLDFRVESAYQVPLGGSESALCYLAEALAQLGHEVYLLNATSVRGMSRGVQCLPVEIGIIQALQPLDVFVVENYAGRAPILKPLLAPTTRFVLWTQHAIDQPGMRGMYDHAERDAYDGIAFVSEWQRRQFIQHFGVDPARSAALRNAISPGFRGLFPADTPLVPQKARPPVLAYTSTPFRGLDVLLDLMPEIRRAVPGTRLKVFSSMRVYQVAQALDEAQFGQLYQRCRDTAGVEYIGSVPQPVLAQELRSAALLAYPNTYAETSCIAVLEAMAAGCWVVTSEFGALPETTAGFASLVPFHQWADADYRRRFVESAVAALQRVLQPDSTDAETHLRRQVTHVNESCTWPVRAKEWIDWLTTVRPRASRS